MQYQTHTWGGMVIDATGTIFDDVIDLRAGKAADFAGGFGGFNDFNTGADIWDGDTFFDAVDDKFDDAFGGFDIWNWQPSATDSPFAEGVASLEPFFEGDDLFAGPFDIYMVELPVANTFTLIAYSVEEMRVVEEVIARDSGGNPISLDESSNKTNVIDYQVFYPDTSNDPGAQNPDHSDLYSANLDTLAEWEKISSNVSVSWPDGFVEPRQFDIYYNSETTEYVAAEFGFAFEPVKALDAATTVMNLSQLKWGRGVMKIQALMISLNTGSQRMKKS